MSARARLSFANSIKASWLFPSSRFLNSGFSHNNSTKSGPVTGFSDQFAGSKFSGSDFSGRAADSFHRRLVLGGALFGSLTLGGGQLPAWCAPEGEPAQERPKAQIQEINDDTGDITTRDIEDAEKKDISCLINSITANASFSVRTKAAEDGKPYPPMNEQQALVQQFFASRDLTWGRFLKNFSGLSNSVVISSVKDFGSKLPIPIVPNDIAHALVTSILEIASDAYHISRTRSTMGTSSVGDAESASQAGGANKPARQTPGQRLSDRTSVALADTLDLLKNKELTKYSLSNAFDSLAADHEGPSIPTSRIVFPDVKEIRDLPTHHHPPAEAIAHIISRQKEGKLVVCSFPSGTLPIPEVAVRAGHLSALKDSVHNSGKKYSAEWLPWRPMYFFSSLRRFLYMFCYVFNKASVPSSGHALYTVSDVQTYITSIVELEQEIGTHKVAAYDKALRTLIWNKSQQWVYESDADGKLSDKTFPEYVRGKFEALDTTVLQKVKKAFSDPGQSKSGR